MRITQKMMTRSYVNRMNNNLTNLSKSNQKMASGLKYSRISDNTSEVSRAFSVREQLYRNEQYTSTIENAEGQLSSAESNLRTVNSLMGQVEDRLLQANTGTMPANEQKLIGREIRSLQEQILQISNASFGERNLFAGSGTGSAPFTVNETTGALSYNGYPVDEMVPTADGRPAMPDPANPGGPPIEINYNTDQYLDVGLGMTVSGSGATSEVDARSALKISISGVDALGYGVVDGMPQNVYSLLGKIITDIESGNTAEMDRDLTQIKKGYDQLLMQITDVGTRTTFLTDTKERLANDAIILKTAQQSLEAVPLDSEVISNKSYEMSWMVTLQLGSKIIPPSIFDFIR